MKAWKVITLAFDLVVCLTIAGWCAYVFGCLVIDLALKLWAKL